MIRSTTIAVLLLASACQVQQPSNDDGNIAVQDMPEGANSVAPAETPPTAPAAPVPSDPSVPPPPHLDPDAPPPAAEKTALGAARRLQEYCDAVATKRYADAYALWSDKGRASGLSLAQFRDSFAKYGAYDCHIGTPGDTEGAAGSIFVEIPLKVTGVLTKGGGFVLEGPVTMRRVNDVDGSTAEQRRWHIASTGLKPRP